MAFKRSPSLIRLLPLCLLALVVSSHAGSIAVYWGQNDDEGSLADACGSGNYAFVLLAYLTNFGGCRTPVLDFGGHCDPHKGECAALSTDIKFCQSKGVKVFLSLGGGGANLASAPDAYGLAYYLWYNFLSGNSSSRPLGDAVLDGIDFAINDGPNQYYDELAAALTERSGQVLLSASPQCRFPDAHLDAAIRTGLFDYMWVQFYKNAPCQYSPDNIDNLRSAWTQWTSMPVKKKVFMGLPASTDAAPGYIPPDVLISQVLPWVKGFPNYGGIMLWNWFFDQKSGYSYAVKGNLSAVGTWKGTDVA